MRFRSLRHLGLHAAAALKMWLGYALLLRISLLALVAALLGVAITLFIDLLRPEPDILGDAALYSLLAGLIGLGFLRWLDRGAGLRAEVVGAAQFTNFADRFREAANVTAKGEFDAFLAEVDKLTSDMHAARLTAPSPPTWCADLAVRRVVRRDNDLEPLPEITAPQPDAPRAIAATAAPVTPPLTLARARAGSAATG